MTTCQIVTEFFGVRLPCTQNATVIETVGCVHEHIRDLPTCDEHTVAATETAEPSAPSATTRTDTRAPSDLSPFASDDRVAARPRTRRVGRARGRLGQEPGGVLTPLTPD